MSTGADNPRRTLQATRAIPLSLHHGASTTSRTTSDRSTLVGSESTITNATSSLGNTPASLSNLQDAGDDGTGPSTKRKRGAISVIEIACNECRKKRTKCPGEQPTCSRCQAANVPCVYHKPDKISKSTLRDDVERLQKYQKSSETVLSTLKGTQQNEIGHRRETLRRLQDGQDVGEIANWLEYLALDSPRLSSVRPDLSASPPPRSETYDAFASMPMNIDATSPVASAQKVGQAASNHALQDSLQLEYQQMLSAAAFDDVSSDRELVAHLLMMYWVWEHPTFLSLSKEHFLRDFVQGNQRFCSPLLLNALLALGSRLSSRKEVRTAPGDQKTAGEVFFREAQRLLSLEPLEASVTTVQALGIMSIRESGCGRDSESWYYAGQSMRLALEMGLHENANDPDIDEDMRTVRIVTFWGAFALDHAWSLATGILPQCSETCSLPPMLSIQSELHDKVWYSYTEDGVPVPGKKTHWASPDAVQACFCELSILTHKSLYAMYSPGRSFTSHELLEARRAFWSWYVNMPSLLKSGPDYTPTPSVLFVLMFYHFSVLLLFRPLIKLKIVGSEESPRKICLEAADAMLGFVRTYAELYTLERTPSFVPYLVLTASVMTLALSATPKNLRVSRSGYLSRDAVRDIIQVSQANQDKEKATTAVNDGLRFLAAMAPSHPFAGRALLILRFLARKWNIDIGESPRDGSSSQSGSSRLGITSGSSRSDSSSTQSFHTGHPRAPLRMEADRRRAARRSMLSGMQGQTLSSSLPQMPLVVGDDQDGPPGDTSAVALDDYGTRPSSASRNFFATEFEDHDWEPGPIEAFMSEPGAAGIDIRRESMGGISGMSGIHGASLSGSGISARSSSGIASSSPGSINVHNSAEGTLVPERPLFWPFPMQGRPILATGIGLKEAGFEVAPLYLEEE